MKNFEEPNSQLDFFEGMKRGRNGIWYIFCAQISESFGSTVITLRVGDHNPGRDCRRVDSATGGHRNRRLLQETVGLLPQCTAAHQYLKPGKLEELK